MAPPGLILRGVLEADFDSVGQLVVELRQQFHWQKRELATDWNPFSSDETQQDLKIL